MWQSNAYSAKSQLQPGGNRTVLRRNCLSSAAACRRIPWSTDRFRNLYQVLSYLNRIIEPSFSVVNTFFALLTHLHEFLEANWGFTYTIITGSRCRNRGKTVIASLCVSRVRCDLLQAPGIETAEKTVYASLCVSWVGWVPFKIRARSAHNNYSSFIIHY